MANPIPYVVEESGDKADAPAGAIPVALFGVGTGTGGDFVEKADVAGLNKVGWGRALFLEPTDPVPSGTPAWTLVIGVK